MNYYHVALLGSATQAFTYECQEDIPLYTYVEVPLNSKSKKGVVVAKVERPSFEALTISEVYELYLDDQSVTLASFIASYYLCSLGEAFALFTPRSTRSIEKQRIEPTELTITLSKEQEEAFTFVKQLPVSLLFGDTGSGKTEIYMAYFHKVLLEGKSALFLMPEISLTPQMQQRLELHFGQSVAIWHSKITKKRKEAILEGIANGSIRIVAGPRSILFLPLQDLGLIIVDEEHDDSYKSGQKPRYHARDLSILLGKNHTIPVVLGSATPSLASFTKFPYIRLKGGFYESKRDFIFENEKEKVTPLVLNALAQNYKQKAQSLVFVPTRANFKYLICNNCSKTLECPFCSVAMSLHTSKRLVRCHYCNYAEAIPQVCPSCKTPHLSSQRVGTAQVAETLKTRFPTQNIVLFDRDTITTDTQLKKVLKAFNDREIDTIVGTQMLSKGHDYHDITLGVIMGIDNVLHQSDYRAREKALSLLIQIIGRAGRKKEAQVIIQTQNREFFEPFLGEYERFLEEEKSFREGFYPPFARLARILFAHKNAQTAENAMNAMVERLKSYEEVEVVGSGKAAIERIAGKSRFTILLRSRSSKPLLSAIKATLHPLAQVDIDPIDFN